MQTTDNKGRGSSGGPSSYFRCAYCGASKRSTDIEYSALGFPQCPVCRTAHGP
ncbi:MAG: hypothetical protein ABEI77_07175 [Halorientalis sp.]